MRSKLVDALGSILARKKSFKPLKNLKEIISNYVVHIIPWSPHSYAVDHGTVFPTLLTM